MARLAAEDGDPLALAEAGRVAAVVRCRAGDPFAIGAMMSAADTLEQATGLDEPGALAVWTETICSTAYTAAGFGALDDADGLAQDGI